MATRTVFFKLNQKFAQVLQGKYYFKKNLAYGYISKLSFQNFKFDCSRLGEVKLVKVSLG